MAAQSQYLHVSVYYSVTGWIVSATIRSAGRPYPRTTREYLRVPVGDTTHDFAGALRAAARALERQAADL